MAHSVRYVMFETDGSVKWESVSSDDQSAMTGSSVFDFEGDGSVEVIYGDQRYLRIYRGTDGAVLYELPKSSGTVYEYAIVADVDADGNAEIIAPASAVYGPENGIFVIGDANDTWVNTREIWNQHTYHITNVNDDGTTELEQLTLHTKGALIDRKRVFVGSLNLDPRSVDINTEMGLLIDSPEMAAVLTDNIAQNIPEYAYRLQLGDDNKITWHATIDGEEVVETKEPQTSGWRRFTAWFMKIVPEKQL